MLDATQMAAMLSASAAVAGVIWKIGTSWKNRAACAGATLPPPREIEAFTRDISTATELATKGDVTQGYDVLLDGLGRATQAQKEGMTWGPALVEHYTIALEQFRETYSPRSPVRRE